MVITEEIAAAAAEKSEKAIFIIGRTAGEDKDYANEAGSYLLTPEELENLKVLTAHFEQVAVLLNVSNIIDMSWLKNPVYKDHIRSVLYIWQGGMESGNAVADVLSGKVSPSGKLTDTIACSLADIRRRTISEALCAIFTPKISMWDTAILRHSARKKSCMSSVLDFPIRSLTLKF